MLVLHGGNGRQQLVEVLRDVCGALAVKYIVNYISRFKGALKNWDVPLSIQEPQNVFPGGKVKKIIKLYECWGKDYRSFNGNTLYILQKRHTGHLKNIEPYLMRLDRVLLKVHSGDDELRVLLFIPGSGIGEETLLFL